MPDVTPKTESAVWGFIDPETGDFIGVTEEGMRRRWGEEAASKAVAEVLDRLDNDLAPFHGSISGMAEDGKLRRCVVCGRTSVIVPIEAALNDAPVDHEPDCALAALIASERKP